MAIAGKCLNCDKNFLECDEVCRNCGKNPLIKEKFDFFLFLMPFVLISLVYLALGRIEVSFIASIFRDDKIVNLYLSRYFVTSYVLVFALIKMKDKHFVKSPVVDYQGDQFSIDVAFTFANFFFAPVSLSIYIIKLSVQSIFDFFYNLLVKNTT